MLADPKITQDLGLPEALDVLASRVPAMTDALLFGSRRYATGSVRSDVDLLVCGTAEGRKPSRVTAAPVSTRPDLPP
jgi:hypothetical protein